MSPIHSPSFKILWITLQILLALIGPHSESASPHLHPYISEFQYVPQYHPSRNPDCASQWLRQFYNERFGQEGHRHSSFKKPFVDQDHPWIKIRAVLVRCSKTWKGIEMSHTQSIGNCKKKVIISVKINNVGKTNTREEFVLVDHVLDPVKMQKIRLRNPYVIKIRQEPLLHLYGLRLQGVVNAEAREEVINNHRTNFTGCNDGLDNPTCGHMLFNEEPIPFSQGFCCSCEDAQRAESFRLVAAKSNYYHRDDGANRTRNRSVSSANLFDNSKAQSQVEASGKEEYNRQVGSGDARGRVTSYNTSAVNGPLGEQTSPLRKQQEEEQLKNNSIRQRIRPLEGRTPWAKSANRTKISVLKNMFSDSSPSKGKIEAYIDAVYEQAMKERAMKHESDKKSKDLATGSFDDSKDTFRRISGERLSIVMNNVQNTTTNFMNIDDYDFKKLNSQEFNSQFLDRSDGRSLIQGSADDPRNPTTKLTKLEGEQGFTKMDGKEDNREFLEPEKYDRSVNFSESGNRQEMVRDRFRGVAQPENAFDYTPTSLAIYSSRIPEESQFSRRTEKNAFLNGDNTLLESFPTTIKFFIPSGVSFRNNTDGDINHHIASSMIKSSNFQENVSAPLSKIMMSRSSTASEEKQYGFGVSENISDNSLRNVPVVRKNLSAAAIRGDEERKTENANVSTRISIAPAFTKLRSLSSVEISLLEELSAPAAVTIAARSGNKSLTKILEPKSRGSLPANEGFPGDFGDLYKGRESRRMYNSSERAPKDMNLKNNYKFWKIRRKLRKSKGAEKFRGSKGVGEKLKRFGKSSRGLTRKRTLSDFKRDSFRNEFSKRDRRFRRHLQTGKEVCNITDTRSDGLTDEDSRCQTQAFTDYYIRPEAAHFKRKNIGVNKNSKKQVILESGYSYRKVQSGENDNPFYFNNKDKDKKNSVDKRIEDKFVRISNVLKEDSTETGIIQETPKNFQVVTKSEVAKADITKIQDELGDNLFSRENGKSDELFAIQGDKMTHEQPAEFKNTRLTVKENSFATAKSYTTTSNEITIASLITRKDSADHEESILFKPVTGSFQSSSITRKFDYNIAKKTDFNTSKNPIYATEFAIPQTKIFKQKLSPGMKFPRGENDYFEITDGPFRTLSSNWASSSKKVTKTLNNRTKNARFLELNNNSWVIIDNFMKPESSPIYPELSSRTSITEPEEISLNDEKGIGSNYTEDPLQENSESFLERSRERKEIAALVDRIVRQYAAYTPIMPGMPTFDEITEAETLPLEEETTVTQFTTTLATTTRITDVGFRASIRPLKTITFSGEMHDEISLDETTFVDETEATTTTHEKTVSKSRFQPGKSANTSPNVKVSNKSGKNGKRRQKITNRIINMTEEQTEDHPWYHTTEVQQIIAANQSKSVQKTEGKGKKRRYKPEVDRFQNTSSPWTSSTIVSSDVAQTRGKRSDLIRAAGNHDSSVFYDYESEDEEAQRSGRTGLNKNEKSPNITEPTELRSTIEKRLADELDYPASRGSSHSCESLDQTQKLNAALQDIAAYNVELGTVKDNLDSGTQKKEQYMQGNLKHFTLLKLRHMKDDAVHKFNKDISSQNREATLVPSGPVRIPRTDLSGSVRERLEIDRRSEKQTFGEQMMAKIDRLAMVRKIVVNVSRDARTASVNDLSDRGGKPREKLSAGGILSARARNLEDKSHETDTVIRGVKLMILNDKRELDVAAKSGNKKIPSLFAARQQGRQDARKINENPADRRVSVGKQYRRRPRGKVHDTVRKLINKIKGKLSSKSDEADTEKDLVESEKRADRSPERHRSGRRLLSSGGSGYIENIDEYYANDENETDRENDSSDNEAIAKRDDLSYLENRSGRREDRDPRKLVAETDRLTDENADVARATMPEERTVAVCDAAMQSDDMPTNSEEAIARNIEKKVKNKNTDFQDIEVMPESTDFASFNDKMLKVPLESEEKFTVQSTIDNNISVQEKSFDNLENLHAYKTVNEESLSFGEKINENNLQTESFYETQPTFNAREIVNSFALNNQNISSDERISNINLSRSSATPKKEENIKISLIGRIQVHGGFNQTPMLISFDAIPDESSTTQSVSKGSSNTIKAIETTINLSLNDSNAESMFDVLSVSKRANDKASDSLSTDESRKAEKTNRVRIKSREKLFDLTRRSGKKRKTARKNLSRIEKRLDKYNTNSRSAKQVFLTDHSIEPNGKVNRMNVGRMISERTGGTIGKLDSRSSANPVHFPDILGSVLVNNDSLKDQGVKEPRCRIETNRSNSIEIDLSNTTTLHTVPLHVNIKKPRIDLANDERPRTTCCPCEDPRNATSGGCYRMPATVRKLEITETTSRELQTWSNYRNGNPTETFPPRFYETTVNDRDAVTMRASPSTRLQNDVLEAAKCTNETRSTATLSSKYNDSSIDAIRVKNMMAIVRFMMKLLRIVAEDEEPPCPRTQIGETMIHMKNVVINASHVERQKSTTDRTVIKSAITRQNLTTITEQRSTITERMREESSPLGTFESFTEVPSHPVASTLATSSNEVSKDEELSTLFETSTGKEVYTSTLSSTTSFATPKSFLFYEPARKSLRKDASRKSTTLDLTSVKQNSTISCKDSKQSGGKKSRLDGSQTNRSSSRDQDRISIDRLHFGKQGIASMTNPEDKIGSFQKKYLAMGKNVRFRQPESTGVANDPVRPILPRDIDVSRDALLERIGAAKENRPECSKSKKAGVSDRRAETRTKLLNRSMRGGSPADWIGEHRAATRLSIDKKLRESCKVPGGTATPGKVVFRHIRGKINRPPDPNLVSGRSDSFKIEGDIAGNGPLAKLSTDDASSTVGGDSSVLEREDTSANLIRYSTSSLMNDNVDASRIGEIVAEYTSVPYKKRDVSERRDFRKGNRVLRKRQKASSPTKRKTKQRRKKKRKKGSQRTRDISETENQQRFQRHLLMTSLKPEYDADDVAARFSRRHVATEKRNAEKFRKSAGSNARQRRKRNGSRTVDGSEVDPDMTQIRGGQDCADRRHPPNIDAVKYLESAHCLRFSDLWYSVYQLEDPIIEHIVYLQVYEKRTLANGSTYWEDLTGDSVVRLGTFNRHHRSNRDTIAFVYKEVKMLGRQEGEIPNLDVVHDRLLIPSSVTSKGSEYPAEDKSSEYLVVPASSINESGNECDKAGVGFAAFARQPDRCGRVRGTCLKNQPLAYRRRDAEARAAGRPGCYFLSNFASVPSEPIKYSANGSGSHEFLALEYHSLHVSAIDIEVEAGYNAALAGGSLGRISEVHVDSTALDHTVVTIVITNTALTSMFYRLRIVKCPGNLPESWINATFPRKIIQARRDQTVSLNLYGELPINEFHCSVQLLNRLGGIMATRRIKIRKMDRCSCMLYCLCVCVSDAYGTCRPMSPEFYYAAGFRGPIPTTSREIFAGTVDVLFFITSSILLLVFMGFLKWLIGLYIPVVGRWGLDSLLETSRMSEYFERELKYKCVVMDEHSAPVHPDTRKRTVRICSRKVEFFLNTMFFLIFPFAICCLRLKKSFHRPVRRRCHSDESKISLTSDRSERPRTICVSTYGDSRDSRMEAEDTKYVIDELKKSEELLRSRTNKVRKER